MRSAVLRASIKSAIRSGLLTLLVLPGTVLAADPDVESPPPPGAVCPAIAEDYALCRSDLMSGNCADFVAAAQALSRLYRFNVEREPERAEEMKTTIWWQCGSASFSDLKALLERIDSPEARAVLAEAPYPSLPSRRVVERSEGPATSPAPDCSSIQAPAEQSACEKRALAEAEKRYRSEVERCEAQLPPPLRDQLVASEAAWRRDRGLACSPDESRTGCLAEETRRRIESIAQQYPECRAGAATVAPDVREGSLESGPRSGVLPAYWTPPQGSRQPVPFSFESQGDDTAQGTMHTTLGQGGERFEGSYLRIQESTKGELVTAMSVAWSGPEWQLWKHDADGDWTQEGVSVGEFARFYDGKVTATLRGDRGHAMRCQFVLKDPEAGLLQGGTGRCQVTDGGALSLAF